MKTRPCLCARVCACVCACVCLQLGVKHCCYHHHHQGSSRKLLQPRHQRRKHLAQETDNHHARAYLASYKPPLVVAVVVQAALNIYGICLGFFRKLCYFLNKVLLPLTAYARGLTFGDGLKQNSPPQPFSA